MRINPPLIALAVGAFGIGVTEFAPMGMLPSIANDLGVSIPTAGLLVSAYAFGVLIAAPIVTLASAKAPRRVVLSGLMGVFTLGNLLAALSGSYRALLIARVVTSLSHGAFFGIGSVVAASVVPVEKRAGAVAAMFLGLTIATIGGVPMAAWFGDTFGWRSAFWGIAGLGAIAVASLWLALPTLPAPNRGALTLELSVVTRTPVLAALALTVVGSSAMFTVFTYIAPILRGATHASTPFVTGMLVLFGIGLTIGNVMGGKAADRSLDRSLIVALAALVAVLLAFSISMRFPIAAAVSILVWGVASFAIVPPLQMRVMEAAKAAPNLASAVNIGAFNLGNALGAALGGAVLRADLGFPAVSLAGAAMALFGLALVLAFQWRANPARVSASSGNSAAVRGAMLDRDRQ